MRDLLSKLDKILTESQIQPEPVEVKTNESGLQYYTGVKKHGKEYMTKAAQAGREGASQEELGRLKDKYSKAEKNKKTKEGFEIGDDFGISFTEEFEIGTEIVDLAKDGVVIELDDHSLAYLEQQGFTFDEIELGERLDTSEKINASVFNKATKSNKYVELAPDVYFKQSRSIYDEHETSFRTPSGEYGYATHMHEGGYPSLKDIYYNIKDHNSHMKDLSDAYIKSIASVVHSHIKKNKLNDVDEGFELTKEAKQRLDPKCWKGYRKQGTKMKGGVRVNNCVKVSEGEEDIPSEVEAAIEQFMETNPKDGDDLQAFHHNAISNGNKDLDDYLSELYDYVADQTGAGGTEESGVYDEMLDMLYQMIADQGWRDDRDIDEAEYQGRKVPLGKPMAGDVKKSKVYVRKPNGKVVKVNFGDKKMRIKKSNPNRRKSFRARHNCKNPGPRWKARYWSCRAW